MPSTPKTTDSPDQTGADERTDHKAEKKVAPGDRTGTIAGQGQGSSAPVTTKVDEPGAPDPTSDRPERGPSGPATACKFPDDLPGKR